MTAKRIGELLLEMQDDFLDDPRRTMTVADAERQFGLDTITSEAILGALVDAGVLIKTSRDAYARLFLHDLPRAAEPLTSRYFPPPAA